jgi:hypothetical protein
MIDLTTAGAKYDPLWTISQVRQLDDVKRSYLLVAAAEGTARIGKVRFQNTVRKLTPEGLLPPQA